MDELMTLLLTNPNPLFIIAAMNSYPSIPHITSLIPAYSHVSNKVLSYGPIEGKLRELLVTLLLATTLSKSGMISTRSPRLGNFPGNLNSSAGKPQISPVKGILTQGYHTGHFGIDIGIPVGTSVKATMNGKVTHAGWNNEGYGNLVIIQNGDYQTYYAHLSEIPVSVADIVIAGTTIGLSGSTGNSTGPHLHYEVRIDDIPVNPEIFSGL